MIVNKIEWHTESRKINDLIPLSFNPRTITEDRKQKLKTSLEKFNLAEIPIINFDGTIIGGNQRCAILQMVGRGAEEIDVRVPNRQLTDHELKEYALTSNTHSGEWDFSILELEFKDIDLEEFNIEIPSIEIDSDNQSIKSKPLKETEPEEKKWFVYINCVTEREAEKMYNELSKKGFETKIVN